MLTRQVGHIPALRSHGVAQAAWKTWCFEHGNLEGEGTGGGGEGGTGESAGQVVGPSGSGATQVGSTSGDHVHLSFFHTHARGPSAAPAATAPLPRAFARATARGWFCRWG